MFDRENLGVRISHITHQQMDRDDSEVALTVLTCEVNPLTPDLAGEVHDKVKRTLYTATGAEVDSLLAGASFNLDILPQSIVVRAAPDQKKASFTIEEAKISGVKAKRSKKSAAWTLEFTVTCAPATEHQLAQIVGCYLKSIYVIFAEATPDLFSESRAAERKARRADAEGRAEAAGESAAATH